MTAAIVALFVGPLMALIGMIPARRRRRATLEELTQPRKDGTGGPNADPLVPSCPAPRKAP